MSEERAPSFVERKAAQLMQERAPDEQPVSEPAPTGIPEDDTGSIASQESQTVGDDVEYDDDDTGQLSDDPEDGAPADVEGEAPEERHDWEKRFKDQQKEVTRLQQVQEERDQEVAEVVGDGLKLKFELEDRLNEAVGRAEYFANVMSGNANQYRNINWAQVPPDKVGEVQAQAQRALAMEQQAKQAWEQVKGQSDEARRFVKEREAQVAKARLKRTIGLNNEVYAQLREHATTAGLPVEEFNQITNPVIIEALHAQMQLKSAGSKLQSNKKRRPNAPRGRTPKNREMPRDDRGKFAKATVEPNKRGSFADRHTHRLRAERTGR